MRSKNPIIKRQPSRRARALPLASNIQNALLSAVAHQRSAAWAPLLSAAEVGTAQRQFARQSIDTHPDQHTRYKHLSEYSSGISVASIPAVNPGLRRHLLGPTDNDSVHSQASPARCMRS
jgi:hypothetical protein